MAVRSKTTGSGRARTPVSSSAAAASSGVPPDNAFRGKNSWTDGSGNIPPTMNSGLVFQTMGSNGLRQFSGWVREEFLPQLLGRQAARVYREMTDNSPTVGAILFAIQQSMRQCAWRVEPPADTPEAMFYAEFVESCMDDMSQPWSDFIGETFTMLNYGFAPHEIVYKRRAGRNPGMLNGRDLAKSKYDDGLIGLRRLPLRGQDTVIKWFFNDDGETTGMTQQPWIGGLIDIPIEKMLLFRPNAHKNNPEGRSVLRNAYRPWYFIKRLEEQEAIMFERFSGFPVITVPMDLLERVAAGDPVSIAQLDTYKQIVSNVRIDEQMGAILPSVTYRNADGTMSNVLQYEFKLVSPQSGRASTSANESIERYKLDIMTSVLSDFLTLGHSSRGTQSLANTKVDLFFQGIEGWLQSNADVLNGYLLPRLWDLNGFDHDLMPHFVPDMPERVDLDVLSNFCLRMATAGMRLFPDEGTEEYLRDVSGLPELTPEQYQSMAAEAEQDDAAAAGKSADEMKKSIAGMIARRFVRSGHLTIGKRKRRR